MYWKRSCDFLVTEKGLVARYIRPITNPVNSIFNFWNIMGVLCNIFAHYSPVDIGDQFFGVNHDTWIKFDRRGSRYSEIYSSCRLDTGQAEIGWCVYLEHALQSLSHGRV